MRQERGNLKFAISNMKSLLDSEFFDSRFSLLLPPASSLPPRYPYLASFHSGDA